MHDSERIFRTCPVKSTSPALAVEGAVLATVCPATDKGQQSAAISRLITVLMHATPQEHCSTQEGEASNGGLPFLLEQPELAIEPGIDAVRGGESRNQGAEQDDGRRQGDRVSLHHVGDGGEEGRALEHGRADDELGLVELGKLSGVACWIELFGFRRDALCGCN